MLQLVFKDPNRLAALMTGVSMRAAYLAVSVHLYVTWCDLYLHFYPVQIVGEAGVAHSSPTAA